MNKIFEVSLIKKAKKQYDKAMSSFYKSSGKLEEGVAKANCLMCSVHEAHYEGKPWDKIFFRCAGCPAEKSILALQKSYINASKEFEEAEKEYANAIFEHLKQIKPKLYSREEKKNVSWEKEFPADFQDVPKLLYSSLVALLEEVGGCYKLL